MTTEPSAAPGWYPHGAGLRWWDGAQWTAHTAPVPPRVATPAAPAVVYVQQPSRPDRGYKVKGVSGTEHMIHLVLTVCTLGLWFPVWLIRSLAGRQRHVPR